jgi:hypothetical protein
MYLPKLIYFLVYCLSILLAIFYLGYLISLIQDLAYTKPAPIFTLSFGLIMEVLFIYHAHKQGFVFINYEKGIVILCFSWLVTIIAVTLGLIFL